MSVLITGGPGSLGQHLVRATLGLIVRTRRHERAFLSMYRSVGAFDDSSHAQRQGAYVPPRLFLLLRV